MTQNIKPDSVDFNALIKNSTVLTLNGQSKMIETLTEEFTEQESKWYIANLYVYIYFIICYTLGAPLLVYASASVGVHVSV